MAAVLSAKNDKVTVPDSYPVFVLGWGYRNMMIVFDILTFHALVLS
jgi:hypothetical protein